VFERLTDRARKVMARANQEAQSFDHKYIGTEHILLGLVKEGAGVGVDTLKNLDIDLRTVRLEVEKLVKSGPELVTMGKLPQMPRAKKVIEYAIEEARNLNHNYVGTEHLLLGLLREHDGVAAQVLMKLGLKLEEVREEVLSLVGAGGNSERKESPNTRAEPPGGFANLLGKARAADGKAAHPGAFPVSITATPAALDRISFASMRAHLSPGSDGSPRIDVDPDIARFIMDSRGMRAIELVIDVSPDPLRELRISLKKSE
jgi:ATP-dependent Clp protease ATP-binding subunit ClpC